MKRVLSLAFIFVAWAMAQAATAPIQVSDAWSRPATGTGVVYATLRNSGAVTDRLIGATSPLATHVGLHQSSESKMPGTSMPMSAMSGMDKMPMGGSMMSMKDVGAIPVPAHGATKLAPGGYHLMLDLRRDVKAGDVIPLRLHFARAGWIATAATVRPIR
jgi:copper(I)-binding protein